MHGAIWRTKMHGGTIQTDNGEILNFRWQHCDGTLNPNDCGHNTRVEFERIERNGQVYCLNVRRAGSTGNGCQSRDEMNATGGISQSTECTSRDVEAEAVPRGYLQKG
jgi:hypothetical protein